MKRVPFVVAFAALLACSPEEVEPGPLDLDTDGPPPVDTDEDGDGGGESGGVERTRVCSVLTGDQELVAGNTVRWHCSGTARGNLKVTLDTSGIPLPGGTEALLDAIEAQGIDTQHNFGPGYGDDFDDPAVVACCEEAYSYPNTPSPASEDAEHGWACGVDCIDQACRALPGEIREIAEENGLGVVPIGCALPGASTPCLREQLQDLANYIANRHELCVDAFLTEQDPQYGFQVYGLGGTLNLATWMAEHDSGSTAASQWPNLEDPTVEADCSINGPDHEGWALPAEPTPCTGLNGNNPENPFESGLGGGFWGADTFSAAAGTASLDGPNYLGVHVQGSSRVVGASTTDCAWGSCSTVSLAVRGDQLVLRELDLIMPSEMVFTEQGNTIRLSDVRFRKQQPIVATLNPESSDDPTRRSFEFGVGAISMVASGRIYGVPVTVPLRNSKPVRGVVVEGRARNLELGLLEFEFVDGLGQPWVLEATFDGWVPLYRAPRADFEIHRLGEYGFLDGSLSSDGDGDELMFEWTVDDVRVGEGSAVRLPWDENEGKLVTLQVKDPSGRSTWKTRVLHAAPEN